MKLRTPLLLGLLLASSSALAQNYVVTSQSMPYQALTTGATRIDNLMTNGGSWTLHDEGWYLLPLGFTFPFYGQNYTDIGINSNGILIFGSANQAECNYSNGNTVLCTSVASTLPDTTPPNAYIAPWNGDHEGPTSGEIRYLKPNASSIIIEFWGWSNYFGSGTFSFQVKLDASGIFQVHYGPKSGTFTGYTGFEDGTGTQGARLLTSCSTGSCSDTNWVPNTLVTVGEPLQADLIVPQVNISNIVKTGNNLTMTVTPTIQNFGKTDAQNFFWKAYLSTDKIKDASDQLIYDSSTGAALTVLQKTSQTVSATANATNVASGNYYVLVEADTTGAVTEFSETNNVGNTVNYFTFGLDLVAQGITGPATSGPGNTVTVNPSWFNQGTDATSQVTFEVLLSLDTVYDASDYVAYTASVATVTGGETCTNGSPNCALTFPLGQNVPGGDFYWGIRIVPVAGEASATNNVAFSSTKTKIFNADLEAINVDLLDNLTNLPTRIIYAGNDAKMTVTLSNLGGADAKNFTVCAVISRDANLSLLNDTIAIEAPVANVPSNTPSQTLTFTVPVPTVDMKGQPFHTGNYYMFAILDCGGAVTELNEGNNTRPVGATTPEAINLREPGADYVVAKVEAPALGAVGEVLPVFRVLKNMGNMDGNAVTYRFFASANDIIDVQDQALPIVGANGQLLDSGTVTLAEGQVDSATELLRIPPTLQPGTWYIGAIVDVAKVEPELEEGNNAGMSPSPSQIVASSLVITNQQVPDATIGLPYAFKLSVKGADGPVTWAIQDPAEAPGFAVSADGVLSGAATAPGVLAFTVTAQTQTRAAAARLVLRALPPSGPLTVSTVNLPPVINSPQSPYEGNLAAAGGARPYKWSLISGSLPNGIALAEDGTLSGAVRPGVPTGDRSLVFEVQDVLGSRSQAQIKMKVVEPGALVITTLAVPDTMVNQDYITDVNARNADGTPLAKPLVWSIAAGTLPEGLTLTTAQDELGLLNGKALQSGTYAFSLQVMDAKGRSDTTDLLITVHASRVKLSLVNAPAVIHPGDQVSFQVTSGRTDAHYHLYSGALPPGLTMDDAGNVSGTVEDGSVGTWNFVVEAQSPVAGANLGAFAVEVTAIPVKTGCSAAPGPDAATGTTVLLFAAAIGSLLRRRRSPSAHL